jgi:hypothetical protein
VNDFYEKLFNISYESFKVFHAPGEASALQRERPALAKKKLFPFFFKGGGGISAFWDPYPLHEKVPISPSYTVGTYWKSGETWISEHYVF